MSAQIDVLAVMDRLEDYYRRHEVLIGPVDDAYSVEHKAARLAVAELIAAAKMANGDHSAPHDCYATGPLTGDPVMDLVVCPGCRLAAALASVGSTK